QYIGGKLEELKETAKVMFPASHVPTGLNIEFPPYAYVSVPTNAPSLRNHAKRLSSTGKISNVKYSKLTNRLYMLNLKIAVALYCYKELNDYETVYETSLNKMAGIHLYEGEVKNWRMLPSPNYDKLWTAGYENQRERERNRRIRRAFDLGIEFGYITFDERNDRFVCRYGGITDIFARFRFDTEELDNGSIPPSRARTIGIELKKYLADTTRLTDEKPLYDIVYLPDSIKPDLDYAKGVLIYMPELAEKMLEQVTHHESVLEVIRKLEDVEEAERKYSDFAQILYMEKIYKVRKNYRYWLGDKEHLLYIQDNIQEKYVEYELFKAFLTLPSADAASLQKQALAEENSCSDEEYGLVLDRITTFREDYARKLGELRVVAREERDGVQKLAFYQMMTDVFTHAGELLK
ncbi:MAG: hypothetical protein FWE68_00980, partial [Defluviitaleaceae bacterium]|nr:hypothetical protein [Defluviitaleaceae bacterium]